MGWFNNDGTPDEIGRGNFSLTLRGQLQEKVDQLSFMVERPFSLLKIRFKTQIAPTGSDAIADINLNGISIFTNQANRPRISAGQLEGFSGIPDIKKFNPGNLVIIDIDQKGSTVPGGPHNYFGFLTN